nr:lamin tail domain-containing protein [Porticoccaceae bacterium]
MFRFSKLVLMGLSLIGLSGCGSEGENTVESPLFNPAELVAVQSKSYPDSKTSAFKASKPSSESSSWDMDKDGNADALTDGLLMLRYTFGLRGDSLSSGAVSANSPLSSAEVEAEVEAALVIADIDGDGQVDALTDGLLLLRYLFGLTDNSLITGAISSNASRATAEAITEYLAGHMPGVDTGGVDDGNGDTDGSPEAVFINEASSSNSTFEDEDGDSPDWFELYNSDSAAIDLTGWSITDDILEPAKWVFPDIVLAAGAYLRVWASDKDRSIGGIYKTLVDRGDNFRYMVPQANPSSTWKNLTFNDSNWQLGASGFGYSDGDDTTQIAAGSRSVYVRTIFSVNDLELMDKLWLDIDFDDGFVAYINGVEIARSNILGETPDFDAKTITDREARIYQSGKPVRFPINQFQTLLNDGDNVLSIQVHNISTSSSDLSLIPFLSAFYLGSTEDGVSAPSILAFEDPSLHSNFKLSSSGDSLTLFDSSSNQIDHLEVTGLSTDKSIGRSSLDASIVYFEVPSPGAENPEESYTGITQSDVIFSHDGGEFDGQTVSLSGAGAGEEIRYTLDATVPNSQSALYSSPIVINDNKVIRARIFKNNHIPSRTESRTYITSNTHSLPIVTLVSEPDNFFDEQTGIYVYGPEENYEQDNPFFGANFWQDWEREVHFSFYEPTGEL